jgi:hypothetical protein
MAHGNGSTSGQAGAASRKASLTTLDRSTRSERRKHPRRGTYWQGMLRVSTRVFDCRIIDVSAEGAQVRLVTPQVGSVVEVGQKVMLTVPSVGRIIANVAWQRRGHIGLRIVEPHIAADWNAAISKPLKDGRRPIVGTTLFVEKRGR